jgi:hypothetical protein
VLTIIAFVVFIAASTTLFSTVLWSKFAHMFFKPAAAFQKKVISCRRLSRQAARDYRPVQRRVQRALPGHSGVHGQANPPNMGLGIKREAPTHY